MKKSKIATQSRAGAKAATSSGDSEEARRRYDHKGTVAEGGTYARVTE